MALWFRMYTEMLNDPKIQRLPDFEYRCWTNALLLAAQNDQGGKLGTISDISFAFRETKERVSSAFHTLAEVGLIETVDETFHIPKWKKRQFKSDTSTERVKRYRQRSKNVTVTPPEHNRTDTDTENSRQNVSLEDFFGVWTSSGGGGEPVASEAAWDKLTDEEQQSAFDAAAEYVKAWLVKASPEYRQQPIHGKTYLTERRWLTMPGRAKPAGVVLDVVRDGPAWEAWVQFFKESGQSFSVSEMRKIKTLGTGTFTVPTRLPVYQEIEKGAAE